MCPKRCIADDKLAKSYCEDLYLTSYNVIPYGASITPQEVLNIYIKQKGLKSSIAEDEIFMSSGDSKNVPCKGDDYFVFRFDKGDTGGNVTDVLCGMFGENVTRRFPYDGYPTVCSGLSEQSCNKIKDLIGNKAPVEFTDNNCTIGEYAPDATKGYIFY